MKNIKFRYKKSTKGDVVSNLLIIIISLLLIFMANKFFVGVSSIAIVVYALSIAFSFCRIAVESIEAAISKKFNPDIISTVAILLIFASQHFLAAALIASIYSLSRYIYEIISSTFSDKIIENKEFDLKYTIIDNNEEHLVFANEIEVGNFVKVKKGDYLSFNYIFTDEQNNTKSFKSGIFTADDESIVIVDKNVDYEIDFNEPFETKENRSKTENTVDLISFIYTCFVVGLALVLFVANIIKGQNTIFESLYILGMILLFANPLSVTSGCSLINLFSIIRLKNDGIFVSSTKEYDKISKIKNFIINKSGVITEEKYKITSVVCADGYTEKDVMELVASAEKDIDNKIAKVLLDYSEESAVEVTNKNFVQSKGVTCSYNDKLIVCGSKKLMMENSIDISSLPESNVYLAYDNNVVGAITISDVVTQNTVKAFKVANICCFKTTLISGDNENTVNKVADLCEINSNYSLCDINQKNEIINRTTSKDTCYIGNTDVENNNQLFVLKTKKDNNSNYCDKKSLIKFIKCIKEQKFAKIYMYVRLTIGFIINILTGMFIMSDSVYNFLHNKMMLTEAEQGVTKVMNYIYKFLIYDGFLSPWIICIVQLVLINLFFLFTVSFINDVKKLRD